MGFGRRCINDWGRHRVPAGVPAAVGPGRRRRLRQEEFKLVRGFGRIDAEIGQRGMPHIEGREGEKPEHQRGGQTVPEDVPQAAISGPEIDGQGEGDRQRGRGAS